MNSGCRLCGSNIMLVNIFDIPPQDSQQMRKCIEVATGLSIHRNDEMGKLVCKSCCDIAILCFKYRRNAHKNAIRIRNELIKIKSNLPQSPSPSYSKYSRSPSIASTSHSATISPVIRYNISASTSNILLRYPSLNVPKEIYTANITPFVKLQDIGKQLKNKLLSSSNEDLRSKPKRYKITKMNTMKLSLKKLTVSPDGSPSNTEREDMSESDTADVSDWNDPGIESDNSETPLQQFTPNSESSTSLLVPTTYKDQFICSICNKVLKSVQKLELHSQKYHKVTSAENDEGSSDDDSNSAGNCTTSSKTSTESAKFKSQPKKKAGSKELVLNLTPIEQDENLRRNYPHIFNETNSSTSSNANAEEDASNSVEISDSEDNDRFRPAWTRGPKQNEKKKIIECVLSFLRTRLPDKRSNNAQSECKNAEVQATTQMDAQFKLDAMGLNEMDILSPEMALYNIPVSILKQSPLKDMTAFFIQYTTTEPVNKIVDWSKLTRIDAEMRQTSIPLSHVDRSNNLSTCSLPSLISLKDYKGT